MRIWHSVIHPITQHFRRKRGAFLHSRFPNIHALRICDLGGSQHFWEKLELSIRPQNITIYNISSDETQSIRKSDASRISVLIYDGTRIPAPDKSFDLLVCNSVLEHVPLQDRAALCQEMARVSKAVFLQTPAWSFPVEPHFLLPFVHWMPRRLGYWLVKISPWRLLSRPSEETIRQYWWGTQLLKQGELKSLFPHALVETETVVGLTKSYYVLQRDFELVGKDSNSPNAASHGDA